MQIHYGMTTHANVMTIQPEKVAPVHTSPSLSATPVSTSSSRATSTMRSRGTTPKVSTPIDIVSYLTPPPTGPSLRLQSLPSDHEPLLRELQAHFDNKDLELPVREANGYEDGEVVKRGLDDREMMYLSRENFIRFLLATGCDARTAITRLEQTIVWRRTENIEDVETLAGRYKYQNRKGKGIVLGFTPDCQPIVYSFINRNPTPVNERRGVDTTFMIERATDLMVDGVSECLVIFQYGGDKMGESSTLNTTRDMLNIISSHYPHKFSLAAFQGMPWLVRTATNVVWPFIDAGLRDHVKYDVDLVGNGDVVKDVLLKQAGGALDYTYDHEGYWDTLIRVCLERRAAALERWRGLGERQTGREERLFKVRPADTP